MPYKRQYTRKRKRKKKKSTAMSYNGIPGGMPRQQVARIRYIDDVEITSTAGVFGEHQFRANGAFDPDYSGTGHTTTAYTKWSNLYNHAVILGSKISIQWVNADNTTASLTPTACGVYLDDDASLAVTSFEELVENRRGSHTILGSGNANSYGNKAVTKGFYSAKKFFNVTDVKDNFDRLGSTSGASPGEIANFHCWAQNLGTTTVTVQAVVTVDYIIAFSEPKTL